MIWLWTGDKEKSERLYLGVCIKYINDYLYVYQYNCMLILLSSPYLLVFGDDRVCDTHEQRMLMQVVWVVLRHGAGESLGVYILIRGCLLILA